jgi:hypothetical protein
MTFLNAILLSALVPLVALPLVIHLLNKKFPRLFYFSSVEMIRETVAQRSKLLRLRHLILLLVRTAFLALLLFAFLKPMLDRFGSTSPANGDRHVLIVLDHSLSMEFKSEAGTARQRAVAEAEKLLDTLGSGDLVNVLLAAQSPQTCFVDFSKNHAEAKRFLAQLKPGFTRADFNKANAEAARLLARAEKAEVYYLSDFQRKNWASVDFTALPPKARIFFTDVGARSRPNRAVLAATINQSQVLAGDTVALEVTVGNFSDAPFRDRVKALLDRRTSFEQDIEVAPWSTAKTVIPVTPGAPGLHVCEVTLPPDGLDADNRFALTLPVLEKEEVLVVSDDPNPDKNAVFYLRTALNPYDKLAGSLLPKHITTAEISAARLAGVKKVFIMRADKLSEAAAQQIAKFMFAGGGVAWFLDGKSDTANLVELEKATGPGVVPMKLALRRSAENVGTAAQQVVKGDFKSRFLKLFRGAGRQDLALLEFYDFYQASSTGAGQVLLTYADESPAMATAGHGLGTLVLLNFSVSEFSSNLARQRIFPAWIQELAKNITGDEPPPVSYTVGEVIAAEVWKSELRDGAVRGPDGAEVNTKREPLGERVALSFVPDKLGFYTVSDGALRQAFGVNAHPDESDLRPVDRDQLPGQSGDGAAAHFVQGREDFETVAQGRPIYHWFVLGALAMLMAELGFQLLFRKLAG